MAEDGRDSVSSEITGAAQHAASVAKSAGNIKKAAASAAAGNYAGAVLRILEDENTRRILAAVLAFLLLMTLMVTIVLPMSVYEGIQTAVAAAKDSFSAEYYSGEGGHLLRAAWSFASTLFSGLWQDAVSAVDNLIDPGAALPFYTEIDGSIISEADAPGDSTYIKVQATREKYTVRRKEIVNAIKDQAYGAVNSRAYQNFVQEFDSGRDVYNGFVWDTSGCLKEMSDMQALSLATLNGVIMDSNVSEIRLADYLKWLGYRNADSSDMSFDVFGVKVTVTGWKGTFMPQYLVDEAKRNAEEAGTASGEQADSGYNRAYRSAFALYTDRYGTAAMDLMIKARVSPAMTSTYQTAYRCLSSLWSKTEYDSYLQNTELRALVETYGGSAAGYLDVSSAGTFVLETEEGYVNYTVYKDPVQYFSREWVYHYAGEYNIYYYDSATQWYYGYLNRDENGNFLRMPLYWEDDGWEYLELRRTKTVTSVTVQVYQKYKIVTYTAYIYVTPRTPDLILELSGLLEGAPGEDYYAYTEKQLDTFESAFSSGGGGS